MNLSERVNALAARTGTIVGGLVSGFNQLQALVYSDISPRLSTTESVANGALTRALGDGSVQAVNANVNFTGTLQQGGVAVVNTASAQTLQAKTIVSPILQGFRPTTTLFTAAGDILSTTSVVLVQSSTGIALRLPSQTSATGMTITIKNVTATAATHTITPRTGTIDGAASVTITGAYSSITLFCTSSNWFISGRYN